MPPPPPPSPDNDQDADECFYAEHDARAFRWALKGGLALACCVPFLGPVGVLYLGQPAQGGGLFAATAAFSVAFIVVLAAVEERIGSVLLGTCAYSE